MPRSMNRIEIVGNLGADPEMRYTASGSPYTTFRVATERHRGQNAEPVTDWHRVLTWNGLAEAVNQYVGKGDRVMVIGMMTYSQFADRQTGELRHSAEIHASDVMFLRTKGNTPTDDVDVAAVHAALDLAVEAEEVAA